MKKILILISLLILVSCRNNLENIEEKNNENLDNKNEEIVLLEPTLNDENNLEDEKRKKEIKEKIEKYREIIKKRKEEKALELEQNKEKIKIPEEKLLDIKFYSQAINWNFSEPYENFCEEASFLNWYYFLIWKSPDLEKYDEDLWKIKQIEDEILDLWYKHTSLQDTLKASLVFQWDDVKVDWEIIENPTIQNIKKNIVMWNPIIAPLHWKSLHNDLFLDWGPGCHNVLIKWYNKDNFIVNEVWISKWDSFEYPQNLIMQNIFNYDEKLYPENFKSWKKEILVLFSVK